VLSEGVRIQGASDDARMVMFRCDGKPLQEQQEIRLECPPSWLLRPFERGKKGMRWYMRTEECKAGVVPDDRVTVAEMRKDALGDRRWELERREGVVEVLR
jgi:hypothetical protein